ncbi:hypothetical protein DBR17_19760 [Sphingomonas sp. HMWF008]|nr:hypothetical protein DBR17_19760 [Sphingomonas sp. HMWF008]
MCRSRAPTGLCDRHRAQSKDPVVGGPSRQADRLPAADFYGLGAVSYSPLARGLVTGKYDPEQAPPGDKRAGRGDKRILETAWRPESITIGAKIALHARARGIKPTAFAIAWAIWLRARSRSVSQQSDRLRHPNGAHSPLPIKGPPYSLRAFKSVRAW